MLDAKMIEQLRGYLEKLVYPVELVVSLGDDDKSKQLDELLTTIADLSDKLSLRYADGARKPAFDIVRTDSDVHVSFAAIPMGHEFSSLVLALLQVGGHPANIDDDLAQQIKAIEGEFVFETYMSLSCQNCPETVQSLNLLSILNPNIRHTAIDGALFQDEVEKHEIMSVPTVLLNGKEFAQGRMTVEEIVNKIDTGAAQKQAAKLDAKDPYEVLVIGGGPAGSAAAIYAARKGIRTGLAAGNIGGQVLDTMAIENFISVNYTEGPKLAAAMESHIRDYTVDVMKLQEASALVPAANSASGLHEVKLQNGAQLKAKTLVLATGARWRQMGVPGEEKYRTRGVAYCPHCDGPLYKGKDVAVIGGGNSGVEAAIDLAGIVKHVTVIEFDSQLRADDVLQKKLHSLANVTVILNGQTTEVLGDGQKVTGLVYKDRTSEAMHEVQLDGIFVQIGLLPNTEWLQGTLELSAHGEIVINDSGATSIPGVYAAGDATTVPFKQIVVAAGAGSTAALGAFDYLIRHSVEEEVSDKAVA